MKKRDQQNALDLASAATCMYMHVRTYTHKATPYFRYSRLRGTLSACVFLVLYSIVYLENDTYVCEAFLVFVIVMNHCVHVESYPRSSCLEWLQASFPN